ncbi:MAG: polymer-forming cytoskeletal protein [Candidatus Omnitrophica bacterium]|nr:polymer-forming cytoskeletal protein [Candidatus Omnitrophota bacterium]
MRKDRKDAGQTQDKVLDVNASMQGTLSFNDPVNLRINGSFEGKLITKGTLMIGDNAQVKADIDGENITIAGTVTGNVVARRKLELVAPARMIGNITAATLVVTEGALLEGNCKMVFEGAERNTGRKMSLSEVSRYLEVDEERIVRWAESAKIPGERVGDSWQFDKERIDEWVNSERIR